MSKKDKKEYEVGYGKPPKSGQFKKGQSGNPKGKPKKAGKTSWDVLADELSKSIPVKEEAGVSKISMWTAIIRQLVHKAAKGDHASTKMIVQLQERHAPPEFEYQYPEIHLICQDMSDKKEE